MYRFNERYYSMVMDIDKNYELMNKWDEIKWAVITDLNH